MRCVILGGLGFLGRHVGRAMAQAGYQVWSVDQRLPDADNPLPWLQASVEAPYFDVEKWLSIAGVPDLVVHLASSTVPATANSEPVEDAEANLVGVLRLLRGLKDCSVRPRLLFGSSGGAVYGRPREIPLTEQHPTMPIGVYGVTKLAIEHHLRVEEEVNGLSYRVLRLSNPYGEWQRPDGVQGVIAVFAHRALHHRPIDVWGDGTVVRDFLYAGDAGTAFVAAASHQGEDRIFNIGAGRGISVNEIIGSLEALLGRSVQRRRHPGRPFDPPLNVLDISLARSALGWSPRVSFAEGLGQTLKWLKKLP